MILKHAEFLQAIKEKRKVWVKFYSHADSGVLERSCAPMEYGPGAAKDGLNRYWLWDASSNAVNRTLSLTPQQIVDFSVLGEGFDPAQFVVAAASAPVLPQAEPPPQPDSAGGDKGPVL